MQAIIFDFDGLILDTETPDYLSWKETYEAFGCQLPLAVWNQNIGSVNFFDPYAHLEEQLGRPVDREAVRARRRQRDDELMALQAILPGVEAYLSEAQQLGLKIGLASSSRHVWVDKHLSRLGLEDHFDVVCCRDDVGDRAKPDPAVYLAALEGLGAKARHSLALEDSPNGILAAKQAGLYCVAVPNRMTQQMDFNGADYRLASLDELPLSRLIEEATRRSQQSD